MLFCADAGGVVAIIHSSGLIHSAVDAFVAALLHSRKKGDWKRVIALIVEADYEAFWRVAEEKIAALRRGSDYSKGEVIAEPTLVSILVVLYFY